MKYDSILTRAELDGVSLPQSTLATPLNTGPRQRWLVSALKPPQAETCASSC